jgi:DNA ligase-1
MNASERLVFHKLLSANFRIGVSRLLVVRALAETAGVEPAVIAHRIAGHWSPTSQDMQRILAPAGDEANTNPALPFPFMLAHALHEPLSALGSVNDWFLEWKWDGIRAQIIRRGGRAILWSRGDEMVGGAFPELVQAACALPDGTVLDGEIVAWDDVASRPLPFGMLQRRLNRKNVEIGFWPEVPVIFIAFDLLEHDSRDVRSLPLEQRKAALQWLAIWRAQQGLLRLSEKVAAESWTTAESLVDESRQRGVEGLMLKRLASSYQPGRPTGLWWKLKVQPYTVDAVLIAAQPGHGKRAGLLTDYTFGVWDESQLVPIAKAYSGLTDAEITEVDRFVRNNTLGRYGPVRAVAPLRVFELGFEAIQRSDRHKSGIALRFPRMLRMRSDKKPSDADNIQTLRNLLAECEARG